MTTRRYLCVIAVGVAALAADPIPVRHVEGTLHGFLAVRNLAGDLIGTGELSQYTAGGRVNSDLVFHFKDGSLYEETTVYSQRTNFQLISYHLVQKGKTFKRAIDMRITTATGHVVVDSTDEKGKEEHFDEQMKLESDLANGLVDTFLKDIDPKAQKTVFSMVVATPKPRIVKLNIQPDGDNSFTVGNTEHKAQRYLVRIDLGGVAGVVAPIVGKQPPDMHVWLVGGRAPEMLRSEGELAEDSGIWNIEMASPVWPK